MVQARRKPFLAATLALAAGLLVAVAFERVYDVRIRARAPDPLASVTNGPPDRSNRSPLTLRMADIGGVGIPLDSWGDNMAVYSAESTFRARHAAIRESFEPLFDWTDRHGMQVFLETDMLAVSSPLVAHLRRVALEAELGTKAIYKGLAAYPLASKSHVFN